MVQPDQGPDQGERTQTPRTALIVVTGLIVVIGAFALGRLTTPEPTEATAASATTTLVVSQPTTTLDLADFRVSDIQTGRQVRWARSFGIGDTWPVAVVEHREKFFLFGRPQVSTPSSASYPPGGLQAWTSDDGIFWSGQSFVIAAGFWVDSVVSTDRGMIALGRDLGDGTPLLWTSDDGTSWNPQTIPLPRPLEHAEVMEIGKVAATDDRILILGGIELNERQILSEYLPDDLAVVADSSSEVEFDGHRVVMRGPWGITGYSESAANLGIPVEIVSRVASGAQREMFAWMSDDGITWQVAPFEAEGIEDVSIAEDGTITVMGFGPSGPTRWTSPDGREWSANERPEVFNIVPWGDGFAGTQHIPPTDRLVTSRDGQEWNQPTVNDLLPNVFNWWVHPIAASSAGIAAFAEGQPLSSGAGSFLEARLAPTVEKGGYKLWVDFGFGIVRLDESESGKIIIFLSSSTPEADPRAQVNFEKREVTFFDPNTQEPLVAFSFEEMKRAEQGVVTVDADGVGALTPFPDPFAEEDRLRAFLFSAEGIEWSVQDMSKLMVGNEVSLLLVGEDRLIAVTLDESFDDQSLPQISSWVGLLP
ncbi:MAG: hypothetical protein U9N56_06420 [Actinomycetota bacterium]|nr:hypothetical protein [Actinomycetota bacterium]